MYIDAFHILVLILLHDGTALLCPILPYTILLRTGKCFSMDIYGQGPHTDPIKAFAATHKLPVILLPPLLSYCCDRCISSYSILSYPLLSYCILYYIILPYPFLLCLYSVPFRSVPDHISRCCGPQFADRVQSVRQSFPERSAVHYYCRGTVRSPSNTLLSHPSLL